MTPREPDRFDAQAREVWDKLRFTSGDIIGLIAAALRAEHASALERAAQEYGSDDLADVKVYCRHVAQRLRELARALIPPAAAPAAECACGPHRGGDAHLCIGDTVGNVARCVCVCHPAPAAETGKAQGAEARPFDKRGADRLADEVDVLIQRHVIDFRSPAADALLDYRDPPRTPRSDRLAEADARIADMNRRTEAWAAAIEYCEEMFSPEWLADPRNRSIFAAHIYRLLNAARVAPPEREGT